MKFTDNELKLSRRLHDALLKRGEPMEIREGDWVLFPQNTIYCVKLAEEFLDDKPLLKREKVILLPSWERLREWLRETSWTIMDFDDEPHFGPGIKLNFINLETGKELFARGATDLEAILSVCVAVAEEE